MSAQVAEETNLIVRYLVANGFNAKIAPTQGKIHLNGIYATISDSKISICQCVEFNIADPNFDANKLKAAIRYCLSTKTTCKECMVLFK